MDKIILNRKIREVLKILEDNPQWSWKAAINNIKESL